MIWKIIHYSLGLFTFYSVNKINIIYYCIIVQTWWIEKGKWIINHFWIKNWKTNEQWIYKRNKMIINSNPRLPIIILRFSMNTVSQN